MLRHLPDHGLPLVQLKEQRRDLVVALQNRLGPVSGWELMQIAAVQQAISAFEDVIADLDADAKSAGYPLMMVTNKPDHQGERGGNRKTIVQGMPECFGEPVVTTLVCFHLSHTRLRVHRAPGIPCALRSSRDIVCRTRARF